MSEDLSINDFNTATETFLQGVDAKMKLNNDKLDSVVTNTANIKASIEVGGDLYVSQDQVEAKLDTIAERLIDDSNSVANSNNAINTNIITQNTKFHNKVAFLAANVDPTTNPPAATTELLLTQDIPQQFQMITLTASADSIDTRVAETNSILTTIDTDTGNIDTKLGAISTLTGANNTIHAAIKTDTGNIDTKLPSALTGSGNLKVCIQELGNEGSERLNTEASVSQLPAALTGGGFLKVSLEDMSTSGTGISTSAKQDTTNTKLDTLETSLTAIEGDIESVIGTASAAHSTGHGVILMGKVGDLTGDGAHSDTGIAQNDAQFIATDPFGNIGVTMSGGLMENSIEYNSGNKTSKTQRVVIATDDIPIALVNTKLDTLEATLTNIETDVAANEVLLTSVNNRLFDDNKSVANAVNSVNTNTISGNAKLDDVNFNVAGSLAALTAIETDVAALEVLQTTTNSKLTTIDSVMDNILVDTSAIKVDAAALEVLQTSTNSKLTTIDGVLDNILVDTSAIKVDAAALEVLQTSTNSKLTTIDGVLDNILVDTSAIKVDAAALEVLQTTTNSKLTTIDSVMDNILIDTSAIKVDAAALEVLQTATNSKLDDVITLLNSLNNKLAASDSSNHYGNP